MKKLRTKGDWTPELLEEYYNEIDIIAKEDFGLDTYPAQLEIITSQQMLDAYSTHAMPVMYDHWRFGKSFAQNQEAYNKGQMGLAYEIISNTNPSIAYLMEENSIMMMALVMAHACEGHSHFFKNNYMFRDWTQADSIVDYLLFAKRYINKCEEMYGAEVVEEFLDAAHALELYGIDRYKRNRNHKEHSDQNHHYYNQQNYDDVIETTLPHNEKYSEEYRKEKFNELEDMEPEENILYFLEKKAPTLQPWKRELLRIVRKIAQYFYPQRMTQLCNESSATFWHYHIMNRLYEKGLVDDGFMLEFYESHTAVTRQIDFDHPAYNHHGINVYALGFAMFMDIKRICLEPTEEDKEYFEWAGKRNWIEMIHYVMRNFRDESLIRQFLSPKIVRDFRMFSLLDEKDSDEMVIDAIHNKEGFLHVRETLADMYDFSERIPNIHVHRVDTSKRRLILRHVSKDRKILDKVETIKVLEHLQTIWSYGIVLDSVDFNGNVYSSIEF